MIMTWTGTVRQTGASTPPDVTGTVLGFRLWRRRLSESSNIVKRGLYARRGQEFVPGAPQTRLRAVIARRRCCSNASYRYRTHAGTQVARTVLDWVVLR
jgi:hypothetical protein